MNNVKPAPGFIDRNRANQLLEKWAPVLNYSSDKVRPIEDEHARVTTAMLMENQERWCLEEGGNYSGNGGAFGNGSSVGGIYNPPGTVGSNDGYAQNDARLPKVLIPMIRRTFPELITNEIVGVQPMSGPVGLAFALRYRYENSSLGANGLDGYQTGATNNSNNGTPRVAGPNELGYQFLDTRFTGTSAASLTGNSDFDIAESDQGVAAILSQFELSGNIPQVTVEFSKTAVEAGTRRLAARWSVELEQGNRDFYSKVIVEANRIAIRNRRGSANFIVATPRVCAILEMLPEFQWMSVNGNVNTQPTGIAKVGTLGGRFTVYRDTRTDAQYLAGQRSAALEYALLGYKGTEYYDTGIVYCPYIPVMIQRTVGPNDFSPRVGLMTRYGVVDYSKLYL